MLLSVLQAPVRNFALAVKAVAEKDEEAAEVKRSLNRRNIRIRRVSI